MDVIVCVYGWLPVYCSVSVVRISPSIIVRGSCMIVGRRGPSHVTLPATHTDLMNGHEPV